MDKYCLKNFSGLPRDTSWSQAVTFLTTDGVEVSFMVCLDVSADSELLDIPMIGLSIVEEMRVRAANTSNWKLGEWKDLLSDVSKGVGEGVVVSMGLIARDGEKVVIASLGQVNAVLWRSGNMHKLLISKPETQAIAGKIVNGDRMSLLSAVLLENLQLREGLDPLSEIEQMIHTPAGEGQAAIIYSLEEPLPEASQIVPKNLRIHPFGAEPERLRTYIAVALLVVLLATIGVGMWRRSIEIQEKNWQELQTSVNRVKSEVGELAKTDPEAAQRALSAVSESVVAYKKDAKGQYITRAEFVSQEITQLTTEILMQNEVALTTWIELAIVGISNSPKQLVSDERGIVYLAVAPELVGISLLDRSQVKSGVTGMNEETSDYLVQNGYLHVLTPSGVFSGKMGGEIELVKRVEPDEAWQTPSRLLGFGSSQYILDTGTGEISKYVIDSDTTTSRKRWFGAGIALDLSKIVDVAIDGDVWLLSSSGKLERYSRGVPAAFSMEGYANAQGEKRFAQPIAVATTEDEVMVLEREKSRVVVFGQDGKYLRQYLNDGFASANDLFVWEGKGYILTENEIKVFEL
jgi:hypothetical protein